MFYAQHLDISVFFVEKLNCMLIHFPWPLCAGGDRRKMEGQIEMMEYLASLEKKGFDILDYIPFGHDNAVTRKELCIRTGLTDREVREQIRIKRRDYAIINLQDGKGYYRPCRTQEGWIELTKYYRQEENRIKSHAWSLMGARKEIKAFKCMEKPTEEVG